MHHKILQFLFVLFLSMSLYGFSRPASEEDELARWLNSEGVELVLDFVPVSGYVYQALKHDKDIVRPYGRAAIEDYHDSAGDGYSCSWQFLTRGGGRICLNFIWVHLYEDYRIPERTYLLKSENFPGNFPIMHC